MTTTINLLAVPARLKADGDLALSIVVSPRLTGATQLRAFPVMERWTALLADSRPEIELRFGDDVFVAAPDYTPLRPDLWEAMFNADTPVDPFTFEDESRNLVVSYRTREAMATVKGSYQRTIDNTNPSIRDATVALGWVEPNPKEGIDKHLRALRKRAYDAQFGRDKPIDDIWDQYSLFYRMPQPGPEAADSMPRTPEALAATLDFHRAVSALAVHPALMRAMGLVVDVTVSAEKIGPAGVLGMPLGSVSVENFAVRTSRSRIVTQRPRVLYHHEPGRVFATADSTGGTILEGFLRLPESRFHILSLDLEGSLAKLGTFAAGFDRADPAKADGVLPALRSAGLSLAMDQRGTEVVEALRRAAEINRGFRSIGNGEPLDAGDLVRGYRLDVWSSASRHWRSLHQRHATYVFGSEGRTEFDVTDEGFGQFAATSPAPDSTRVPQVGMPPVEGDLYVHESLVRWNGWSLSAPRPGKPLHRSDTHEPMAQDDSGDPFVTAFQMRQEFSVLPGSLPKLRFGTRYRMRIRIVDVAGNSPDPSEQDALPVSQPAWPVAFPPLPEAQLYQRYEPVPHPLPVMRTMPETSRELLDRVVIRSYNADPSRDTVAAIEVEERHIAPPRASVELIERHGLFDDAASRLKGDGTTFADLVARNDSVFATELIGTPPTETPIERGPQLTVDYLPDPLARSAAFRNLPGVRNGVRLFAGAGGLVETRNDVTGEAGPVLQVGFGDTWPDRRAFRLAVVEGEGAPAWNVEERVLTVQVAKAADHIVRLSSALADADLELMALWSWLREKFEAASATTISSGGNGVVESLSKQAQHSEGIVRLAQEGGLWALTPSIPLRLVHAVQQPIGRPKFLCATTHVDDAATKPGTLLSDVSTSIRDGLVAMRAPNSPSATLVGELGIHLASTGRIDIQAAWDDVLDAGVGLPSVQRRASKALIEPIILGNTLGRVRAQGVEERTLAFVDSEERLSFRAEYYRNGNLQPAEAPNHAFGDTRHRRVTYTPIATSRFVSDFPDREVLDFTRVGESLTISVPSSARPPAPRIVQILPTFGWQRESAGTLATSVRSGFGLRIYLDRPWYSSGEGELLGVLLWPEAKTPPTDMQRRDELAGLITEWGLDPVRHSGWLRSMPAAANMAAGSVVMTDIRHPSLSARIDVVGYEVHFDDVRGLWYADVTLDSQRAYTPFIRLALARFQPHSIAGAEVSTIAPADFIQLTPDRSAVLIADPDLPLLYRLIVSGVGPEPSTSKPWRNALEVTVEERRANVASDLGWQQAGPEVVTVTPTATTVDGGGVLFSGLVEFAALPQKGQYRLVIREYEIWETDRPAPWSPEITVVDRMDTPLSEVRGRSGNQSPQREMMVPPPGTSMTSRAMSRVSNLLLAPPTGRRLVYAEFFPVAPSARAFDASVPNADDGPIIGGPGPIEGPPEMPFGPPYSGPAADAFTPNWDDLPSIGEAEGEEFSAFVKLAQAMLNGADFLPEPLAIDGVFSGQTSAALAAFRASLGLGSDALLDTRAWIALAVASPFPVLEPGFGSKPMAGPPVALLQRLLDIGADAPIAEQGVYSQQTSDRVAAFQAERGLEPTGIVDSGTWSLVADSFDMTVPYGAEEIVLSFERTRLQAGGPAVELVSRIAIENTVLPVSQRLDEDWSDRSGLWLELQDISGRPLFRHLVGIDLNRGRESLGDPNGTSIWSRPSESQTSIKISVVVPGISAARSLVVFGNLAPGDPGPASVIGRFEL